MSQMNMLKYSARALLLLLPWLGGLVIGEISNDFSKCSQFFYEGTPPKGIDGEEYQPICQRYKNQYRFASLYNRQDRTPLYSAYKLSPADGNRPNSKWMYEPQLVSVNGSCEMKPFPQRISNNLRNSQAVPQDYTNSGYTRGHLNPSMHQPTEEDREATFTLTNVVPQHKISNTNTWNKLEQEVLKRFKLCEGTMYVITGVIPYQTKHHRINDRVSVPEYMWSAYCCPSYSSQLPESMRPFFPTYAAVGRNDPNSEEDIVLINVEAKLSVRGYDVKQMPLEMLEDILGNRLRRRIRLFDKQCQNYKSKTKLCYYDTRRERDNYCVRHPVLEDILKKCLEIEVSQFVRQAQKLKAKSSWKNREKRKLQCEADARSDPEGHLEKEAVDRLITKLRQHQSVVAPAPIRPPKKSTSLSQIRSG